MRVMILEFLDTDVFHVSAQHCDSFLEPLIDSWEIASGARPSADPKAPPKNPLSKSTPSSVVLVLMPRCPETRTVPRPSGSLRVSGVRRIRSW